MRWMQRSCALMLAISLSLPLLAPTSATAASDSDPTNELVAFSLLGAVIGILVYVGWQMDKEDDQHKTENLLKQAMASTGDNGSLRMVCPAAREGEQVVGLGYGLAF